MYVPAGSQPVKGFSLSKKFLHERIFQKYKDQALEIKSQSILRYKTNIRKRVLKHRLEHLKDVNKKSSYKQIQVTENSSSTTNDGTPDQQPTADMGIILKQKIDEI